MKKELITILTAGCAGVAIIASPLKPDSEKGRVLHQPQVAKDMGSDVKTAFSDSKPKRIGATGSTIYGFMSYKDEDDFLNGMYELQPSGKTERMWEYPYASYGASLTNGWLRDGKLCGLCVLSWSSEDLVSVYAYQELDLHSGELIESRPIDVSESYVPYFYTAAYIPSEDRIYGFGKGEDSSESIYYFKSAPADRPEDTEIIKELDLPGDRCYSLCYSVADGCLYGVNTRGMLVKILTDGTMTELFDVSVPNLANIIAALTVSPNDGFLIWNPGVYSNISEFYAIYPSEKKMEKLYKFPIPCNFTFFLSPDGPTDATGPAASEFISTAFEGAALNGTLKFRLPSSTMNASPLSGTLDWTLYDNGKELAKGNGSAGSEVSVEVTTEQGEHTFRVENEVGGKKGYPLSFFVYVGNDVPKAPENVKLTQEKITWDAVTEGNHDGYMNASAVTYKVYLNDKLEGTVSSTEMTVELDEDQIQDVYYAKVVAECAGLESLPGISEKAIIGRPYSLPMTIKPTEHDGEMVTIINADGSPEYGMWRLTDAWGDLCFASGWSYEQPDDWLIMPAAQFDSNEVVYEVSLEAARGGYSAMEYFEVWAGEAPTVEAMTIPVMGKTRAQKFNEWKEYSGKFAVPRAGKYYIAVRGCSNPDQKDLIVRNIRVSATDIKAQVPGSVTDLQITGASNADLTATLKFTMPEKYINGEDIPSDKELTAVISSAEKKEIKALPGETVTVTVGTAQGENYITVIVVSEGIESTPAEVSLFTGMDFLSYVEDFNGVVSRDNMSIHLTWKAPVESLYGGYVAFTGIEYMIGRIDSYGEFIEEPINAGTDVYEYEYVLPAGTAQDFYRIGIAPKNAAGISPARSFVGKVLGTPFTMPMEEKFNNMEITYKPLQASAPSSKYSNGGWTWCQPELVNPSFANSEVEFGVIGYTDEPEAWVRMGLPRISTAGLENAHAVFKIWNGVGTATQKGVYGLLYDMAAPEKIMDIPSGDGWQDVIVEIPAKFLGQEWIGLYIDGCLPTAENYLLLGGYSMKPTSGVSSASAGASSIIRNGNVLTILNPEQERVSVSSVSGILLYSGNEESIKLSLPGTGVYFIKIGGKSYKMLF